MDPKLTLLVLLIGTIVGLSHVRKDGDARLLRSTVRTYWRNLVPAWRRH